MKATELRIGNLVDVINRRTEIHIPFGIVKQIGKISFFEVDLYHPEKPFAVQEYPQTVSISDLSAIELTEEWLLKFGFDVFTENSAGKRYAPIKDGVFSSDLAITFWGKTGKLFRHDLQLKYVHQLQNLYFALTGEELKIKDNVVF